MERMCNNCMNTLPNDCVPLPQQATCSSVPMYWQYNTNSSAPAQTFSGRDGMAAAPTFWFVNGTSTTRTPAPSHFRIQDLACLGDISALLSTPSWAAFQAQSTRLAPTYTMQSYQSLNQQQYSWDSSSRSSAPHVHMDMYSGFPCVDINSGAQDVDSLATVPNHWDINSATSSPAQSQPELDDGRSFQSNTCKNASSSPPLAPPEEEEDAEIEETEELGHVEIYADYKPSKSTIGISHPDMVVETSTLSSVPPPDITYNVAIPESVINSGQLSALQLESVIYACQQHEMILLNNERAGFLIGDGAGVGKGRTIAGIILENYMMGRKKTLWFSVSNDLKFDAERDLKDIDAYNIPVYALSKIKYGDIAAPEGVLFVTYAALIGESKAGGQIRTRIRQILDWCTADFDGVIVFDECHKAKNAWMVDVNKAKMAKAVLDLQDALPRARVVYASATGASEPKNMVYMSRLGIWGDGTPFKSFEDFLFHIETKGIGAMEIVAMDMKVSGMYLARQLSFSGVSFRVEEISLDDDSKLVYNKACQLWVEALQVFTCAADKLHFSKVENRHLWAHFWSTHQRFFKYLCIAAKVDYLVELAQKEMEAGKCIVIGLQSTGEARTKHVLNQNDGHVDRFVSLAEGVFRALVINHFPSGRIRTGNKRKHTSQCGGQPKQAKYTAVDNDDSIIIRNYGDSSSDSDSMDMGSSSSPDSPLSHDDDEFDIHTNCKTASIEEMKQGLLNKISELGKYLPFNTLDELIDKFGGPEKVAEMTSRKGRVVRRTDGSVHYESRAEQGHTIEYINIKEKDRFMSGEKLVAIISEAASSGISLQADKRVKNQRRRVHMTLELPWSADRAIQQFGRTHRSNQVMAPEYVFLISELAGERRFASIVAKRLESLGALTHGDRRATESSNLINYNFVNKHGTKALDTLTKSILGYIEPKVCLPKAYQGDEDKFFGVMKRVLVDVGIFRMGEHSEIEPVKHLSVARFLNRILGLEVDKQNHLFQYFTDNFDYLVEKDKKEGNFDRGILDLAPGNNEIYEEKQEAFLTTGYPQDGQVVLYKISVDRGMPWEEACEKAKKVSCPDDGFYLSHKLRGKHPCVLLAKQSPGQGKYYVVYKPNIGKQALPESLDSLLQRYRKVTPDQAKASWEHQFTFSSKKCSHANWTGRCVNVEKGQQCMQGMRIRQYHMLCGTLLHVWSRVANVVYGINSSSILQIVRLKTKQHNRQVGIAIPGNCIVQVREKLVAMDKEVRKRRKLKERQALWGDSPSF